MVECKIEFVLIEHGGLSTPCPSSQCPPVILFWQASSGDHSEAFFLFEYFCGTPPSGLKVGCRLCGGWLKGFYYQVLEIIGTWMRWGPGGCGTKGLRPGLENKEFT